MSLSHRPVGTHTHIPTGKDFDILKITTPKWKDTDLTKVFSTLHFSDVDGSPTTLFMCLSR